MTRPISADSDIRKVGSVRGRTSQVERRPSLAPAATGLASQYQYEIKVCTDLESLEVGDNAFVFAIPADLNNFRLSAVAAFVTTNSSSGLVTVQIRNRGSGHDMLTTRITIDASESTSYTAATPAVIDTSWDDVTTGQLIAVDIDTVGTGTKGLGVILTFVSP